jgi:hypothetical protein
MLCAESAPSAESSRICRHDLCELVSLHLPHEITAWHVSCPVCGAGPATFCILLDSDESPLVRGQYHRKRTRKARYGEEKFSTKSADAPWKLRAPAALDDSILKSVSPCTPRVFSQIIPIVEDDFGSLGPTCDSGIRRVQRHLKSLCDAGRVLKIDLGQRLFAYLAPESRLASDIDTIRDQLADVIDYSMRGESFA